jgi:hypothetical protein
MKAFFHEVEISSKAAISVVVNLVSPKTLFSLEGLPLLFILYI